MAIIEAYRAQPPW